MISGQRLKSKAWVEVPPTESVPGTEDDEKALLTDKKAFNTRPYRSCTNAKKPVIPPPPYYRRKYKTNKRDEREYIRSCQDD